MSKTTSEHGGGRRILAAAILVLLLTGLASSIYLTDLFIRVHDPAGQSVESFCAVSEGVNCVTVADSEYSTVLRVPVSVYGLEFYLVALLALALGHVGARRVEKWPSIMFWFAAASLPICGLLAYVSTFLIHSICLMCCVVYTVNLTMFVTLLVVFRKDIRGLLADGPREAWRLVVDTRKYRVILALVAVAALSQFAWLPPLLGVPAGHGGQTQAWNGIPIDGQTIGSPDAPVKIEEFTDFECPWCSKSNRVVLDVLFAHPRKIHLVHRDMAMDMSCNPLMTRPYHRRSCRAAIYARCAGRQGKFWPYSELLFQNRKSLGPASLDAYAQKIGLNLRKLHQCVDDPTIVQQIQQDIRDGHKRGVTGTPTYFVNGEKIVGYRPPDFWEAKIKQLVETKTATDNPAPATTDTTTQ